MEPSPSTTKLTRLHSKSPTLQPSITSSPQPLLECSAPQLFTFLDHDGVPWNNNNAEHAIEALGFSLPVVKVNRKRRHDDESNSFGIGHSCGDPLRRGRAEPVL